MQHRWLLPPRASSVIFTLSAASALLSCGSSKQDDAGDEATSANGEASADACYSCGVAACPDQAAACDGSPVCATLRDCTLNCDAGDDACTNECTIAAASDSNAIVRGAEFVACATANCPDECVSSPSSGPNAGPGPSGGAGLCQELNDWAAGCNLDVSSQIPDCTTLNAAQECIANCITSASCADFQAASTGAQNTFTTCMTNCVSGPVGMPVTPTPAEPPPTTGFYVAEGGFVTSGAWQGFAWTATDGVSASAIQPADFSASLGGGGLCASGTVAGTVDYSAVAMVGINLNQPNVTPTPAPAAWTPPPASLGIGYQISNVLGSPLRIQLQAPGGDTNANLRFCAEANGTGTYAWSSFNTACWDGSGTNYNGTTPLESIMVLVPGAQAATSFDFCVQSITPQ